MLAQLMKYLKKRKKWVKMKDFQLDIITPTNIESYNNISYVRIPALDGLTGIQAKHATAIIGVQTIIVLIILE